MVHSCDLYDAPKPTLPGRMGTSLLILDSITPNSVPSSGPRSGNHQAWSAETVSLRMRVVSSAFWRHEPKLFSMVTQSPSAMP